MNIGRENQVNVDVVESACSEAILNKKTGIKALPLQYLFIRKRVM